MKRNVGSTDAFIRVLAGMLIWASGFIFHSWLSMLGLVFVFTGIMEYCPLYRLLRINNAAKDEEVSSVPAS